MTSLALSTLSALPAALDQTSGSAFGMKRAMLLMAAVAVVVLAVCFVVGNARARRNPPRAPQYPILAPPTDRDDAPRPR